MTYAPASLMALARYWTDHDGENLGIVGDSAHAARASYHNGLDRAIKRYGTSDMDVIASRDYTFRQPRDRAGATNAAMGFDLGRLGGHRQPMRDFSVWLVKRCQDRATGTADVREVIYSPDGKVVKRWDGVDRVIRDGYPTATGQGDSSHLWHTHISFFRDSEGQSKVEVFRPYFEEEPTVVITRTAFVGGPRVIRFLPGAKAAGYVPRKGVLEVAYPERTWTAESAAKAAYDVTIDGKRYFQMIEGYYGAPGASSYVPASALIVADPDPRVLTENDLALSYDAGIEDATRAVQMLPRRAA